MDFISKGIVTVMACLVLTSCVTAKIESNAADAPNYKMEKVFVLVNTAQENEEYSKEFYSALEVALSKKNIESSAYIRTPLTLDTKEDIDNKINAFQPEHLMIIDQTRMTIGGGNIVVSSDFQFSIIEYPSNEPTWKGILEVWTHLGIRGSIKKSIRKLMEDLESSKIVN